MDIREILKKVDHTLLGVTAGWSDIEQILIDAEKFGTASACIPPAFVKRAKEYVGDRVKICTVIGFPNGYNTTAAKVFETEDAVANGADEIDMVINVGELKSGNTVYVENEIKAVRAACEGKILKVIIETCLLTENEKITMCDIVTRSGADYIKTSTGFSTGGATVDDVRLMRENVGPNVKVKAAGKIRDAETMLAMVAAGAERIGARASVAIMDELRQRFAAEGLDYLEI